MAAPLERRDRWLVAELGRPHRVLSWAIVGGGARLASRVAWCEVGDRELAPPVDARSFLRGELERAGLAGAVAMMTGRRLDAHVEVLRARGDLRVRCVATVGMHNARRVADPADAAEALPGTINVLCQVSVALSEEALVEALALATEARTVAVLESGIASPRSGLAASGTGTDCLVVAAPDAGPRAVYAGKHTVLGELVGAAVIDAVARGARDWLAERAAAPRASGA